MIPILYIVGMRWVVLEVGIGKEAMGIRWVKLSACGEMECKVVLYCVVIGVACARLALVGDECLAL